MPVEDLAAVHWRRFVYLKLARRWHALWCRWSPSGELRSVFDAERAFEPTGKGCSMQVVYHYRDERGTVAEGPQSGPWHLTEEACSTPHGMLHPASPEMTTLLLPGGPSAWCMRRSPAGTPCAAELFLHHGDHLRMSAGVVHSADGTLQQLALVREDARGPWPSAAAAEGWSESCEAAARSLAGVAWQSTRVGSASAADAVLLCAGGTVAVVAPTRRVANQPFSSAAAWWPPQHSTADSGEGEAVGGRRLYTVEAHWDAEGGLAEVRWLVFEA
ncbi:hypothetical protein EMIHUDRAFT_238699 [Emiliania huxleyi CCMP1516]|uniref:DUF3598 domain-containing protein n=2 Tax=Emiliania huxleyi TaxID=2903 RepID=A0A0D3I117_EMIH1|nr:hypothetical protein EMIHUDRAFT_220384 [Emiliania huxleyi CCMP1516]XP_005776701.1 hypothetical protein EMIHUDRAFT_238699 [Emiliania huxleyi CCMP1516]EOD04952.1 hypothetical protein EMIHUDRAFT_220384 [Emiliania huxleyi CCMP1516]EOD24272.1 hypothetical protein EMIHUDRAFT_238699 [Emiliania huxleyi CCMP1516]|eukprot:XP_005757381.1 hypothetical protein EMIHUDRAFT_220384 [Emiliania huxleyi CCMP1516]